ncbi:hydrolase [Leuconostoc citreum]|uniref:hydrolase n=1 Tax=Leuconostoc citreum TaxID=33964 RepID=UPI002A7EA67F|nr:hydrolase [Leuconostoc citreum]MDY5161318.1 hydrolase [Leuconostoc citreum]MDY5164869.1 hydrolase [Leuconostoc citreum]
MTNQETQTTLQPDLLNRIDNKILYLGQLQLAITKQHVAEVYELLATNNDSLSSGQQLPLIVSDLTAELTDFLAPELMRFFAEKLPFLSLTPSSTISDTYDVFLGDWWHHRQLGTLNILSITLSLEKQMITELQATEKLSEGQSINESKVQEINENIKGLKAFLADNTKRTLELQVVKDQLTELSANKSGLFNRNDKNTREALEKKRELLEATQKRIPEVERKLVDQENELLAYEKDDALRQLELQAILSQYSNVAAFVAAISQLHDVYLDNLKKG